MEKVHKAGMICSRIALKCISLHQSIEYYELEFVSLAADNIEVGNINHSRKFAQNMISSFYRVLYDKMKSHLEENLESTGRPSPISVIAL